MDKAVKPFGGSPSRLVDSVLGVMVCAGLGKELAAGGANTSTRLKPRLRLPLECAPSRTPDLSSP